MLLLFVPSEILIKYAFCKINEIKITTIIQILIKNTNTASKHLAGNKISLEVINVPVHCKKLLLVSGSLDIKIAIQGVASSSVGFPQANCGKFMADGIAKISLKLGLSRRASNFSSNVLQHIFYKNYCNLFNTEMFACIKSSIKLFKAHWIQFICCTFSF